MLFRSGKINVDTDIRLAITRNIREFFVRHPEKQGSTSIAAIWALMEQNPSEFDPRAYLVPVMEPLITGAKITDPDLLCIVDCIKRGVKEAVGTLIVSFGSVGYASKIPCVSLEEMAERYRREGI